MCVCVCVPFSSFLVSYCIVLFVLFYFVLLCSCNYYAQNLFPFVACGLVPLQARADCTNAHVVLCLFIPLRNKRLCLVSLFSLSVSLCLSVLVFVSLSVCISVSTPPPPPPPLSLLSLTICIIDAAVDNFWFLLPSLHYCFPFQSPPPLHSLSLSPPPPPNPLPLNGPFPLDASSILPLPAVCQSVSPHLP